MISETEVEYLAYLLSAVEITVLVIVNIRSLQVVHWSILVHQEYRRTEGEWVTLVTETIDIIDRRSNPVDPDYMMVIRPGASPRRLLSKSHTRAPARGHLGLDGPSFIERLYCISVTSHHVRED